MERRTVIVYCIFAAAVIYGAYFHLLSAGENKGEVSGPATAATVRALPIQSPVPQGEDRDNEEEWIGDPFRDDHKYRKSATPISVRKIKQVRKPQLSAISVSEGGAMVVVDGRILAVGEKVGPWHLVKITRDAALFEGPGGSTWIRIGESK